ncbi:unnamed protein product, partial [Mesorhabditis spiculigera]
MKPWLLTLLIFCLVGYAECEDSSAKAELDELIESLEQERAQPKAEPADLEDMGEFADLEKALEGEAGAGDQEYAKELLTAIKSVRQRYDELKEKWDSAVEGKVPEAGEGPKLEGLEAMAKLEATTGAPPKNEPKPVQLPLSRAKALGAQTVFQNPIAPPSGWADFENDAAFEEISAPDSMVPETTPPTTTTQPLPPRAPVTLSPSGPTPPAPIDPIQAQHLNSPAAIDAEITALMDLWERGPMSERLRAADDQRIEKLLGRKDLDQHAKHILFGKRRLRRLLILSRLFEDRSRILVLVEAQRKKLQQTLKAAQNRVPKNADPHGLQARQVSRSRVQTPPIQAFETKWPAVRETFVPPTFDPATDTLDTAVERGFVETDPEFAGRRPRRKFPRRGGDSVSPLLARLLPVHNRRNIDEGQTKIINLNWDEPLKKPIAPPRMGHPTPQAQRTMKPATITTTTAKPWRGESREKYSTSESGSSETHLSASRELDTRSAKPDRAETLEMCTQIECDFEKGDLCKWESSSDEVEGFLRRHKRSGDFSVRAWSNVAGRPDRAKAMERNAVFTSVNTHFAAAYVNGSEVATLTTQLSHRMPVVVRFTAWEATREVRLRMCCDDFCPFSTEEGVKRGHRKWLAHTVKCPAGTKQITFECVNTGEWSGRCGLDSIYFSNPVCPDLLPYTEDEE